MLAGLTACQPQDLDDPPSACSATIAGSVRNRVLTAGQDRATLNFQEDAEVRVTGTVTNLRSQFSGALSWRLRPLPVDGAVAEGATMVVDTVWTSGPLTQDLVLEFDELVGIGIDYDWDLQLTSTSVGCPPPNPTACAEAGWNYFFNEPIVIDGVQREGCFKIPSCIDNYAAQLSDTDCDEDDVIHEVLEQSGFEGYLAIIGGVGLWMANAAVATAGQRVGAGIATGSLSGWLGPIAIAVVVFLVARQAIDAYESDREVVDGVIERHPEYVDQNDGIPEPDRPLAITIAIATCLANLAIDVVIANAARFGLVPGSIDINGWITLDTGRVHLCDRIPVYMPGGSTHRNGVPMMEASLHIREVLYNDSNGPATYPTPAFPNAPANPVPPQSQWHVLTRATEPTGSPPAECYREDPYFCRAVPNSGTACDEWPWFRTDNGGSTVEGGPGAHLRIIDGAQNSAGGSDWLSFMAVGLGCNIPIGSSFAVVPLEAPQIQTGARSVRLCAMGL